MVQYEAWWNVQDENSWGGFNLWLVFRAVVAVTVMAITLGRRTIFSVVISNKLAKHELCEGGSYDIYEVDGQGGR